MREHETCPPVELNSLSPISRANASCGSVPVHTRFHTFAGILAPFLLCIAVALRVKYVDQLTKATRGTVCHSVVPSRCLGPSRHCTFHSRAVGLRSEFGKANAGYGQTYHSKRLQRSIAGRDSMCDHIFALRTAGRSGTCARPVVAVCSGGHRSAIENFH